MAYSSYTLVGDGVSNTVPITFPLGYNSQSEISVRVGSEVDGLGQPVYRTLTWINANLVSYGTAAGVGVQIRVVRTVDKTVLAHDYTNGAPITEENLDDSNRQNLMAVHEALDGRFGTFQQDLDMGNFKIINMADPASPQDAATKAYVDSVAVLPSGNVPPPTLGNVGWFLKATATGVWAWAQITIADVLGAAVASIAQVRAGTTSSFLVSPLGLASIWKKGSVIATASTLVRPSDANIGGYHDLSGSVTIDAIWPEPAGTVLKLRHVAGGQINHSANLVLNAAGQPIVCGAGDTLEFTSEGSGVWTQTGGLRKNGLPYVAPVVKTTPGKLYNWQNMI